MWREPPSRQRRVALAGIRVNVAISIFALAVDDVLPIECVVHLEWFVRPKAVGIDGQRLLLAVTPAEIVSSIHLQLSPGGRRSRRYHGRRG